MSTVLILLNGKISVTDSLRRVAGKAKIILCADGGVQHAVALKIQPTLVIGDMDSIPAKLPKWRRTVFLCDFDANVSDFEKTLRFLNQRGFRRLKTGALRSVYVAGALGGRLDHSLVNLALIEKYSDRLPLVALMEDSSAKILGPGNHRVQCRRRQPVTLLPITARARVSTAGLLYPLRRELLNRSSRGLSNISISRRIQVKIHSGKAWIIL